MALAGPETTHQSAIERLPEELLLGAFRYSTTADLLALRLVSRTTTRAASTVLSEQVQRVYVLPTRESVQAAIEICQHVLFSQGIKEIVFLTSVDSMVTKKPSRRTGTPRSASKLRRTHECPGEHPRLRRAQEAYERYTGIITAAYSELIGVLASLPRATYVSFSAHYSEPGFIGPAQSRVSDAYSLPTPALATYGACPQGWLEADLLFVAIENVHIQHLQISQELSCMCLFCPVPRPERSIHSLKAGLSTLTHLELTFDAGYAGNSWQQLWSRLLPHTDNLRHLHVNIAPNADRKTPNAEGCVGCVLHHLNAQLHTFSLTSHALPGQRSQPDRRRALRQRQTRPSYLYFDILQFLARQVQLKSLKLINVLFSSDGRSAIDVFEALLNRLEKGQVAVQLEVNMSEIDPRCMTCDVIGNPQACEYRCGQYNPDHEEALTVQDIEALASRMFIRPSNDTWIFFDSTTDGKQTAADANKGESTSSGRTHCSQMQ